MISATGQTVFLNAEETHHLKQVLRLSSGDRCFVFDPSGREAVAEILKGSGSGLAELRIHEMRLGASEPGEKDLLERFFFYVALPKKRKFDTIVEKAQELRAAHLQPLVTHRTENRIEGGQSRKVAGRWEKIASEASKQSGALRFTRIELPAKLEAALKKIPMKDKIIIFHPDTSAMIFRDWLKETTACLNMGNGGASPGFSGNYHLFFGPEGGFSPEEIQAFKGRGGIKISLGTTVLKTDTAFLSVLAALRFQFDGDFGN
ncbi:MAG: hypothetical protein A2Z83_02540 [Omnitrophica bacterium GWA2_52_8]|nr:MAG: hypothetical protein A2Z83_02540 [Omnitrophica bacterium GWA2_52_8]